jgi:regulatory protein
VTFEQALSIAHVLLNRRERTEHELREQLLRRDAPLEVVNAVVRELTELGYVDDARFARLLVQDKRDLSQWGRGRIERELIRRGISKDLAAVALGEELSTTTDELERALALLRRRFPAPAMTGRQRERALGLLLRRGYEYELAIDALVAHVRAA